MENKNEKNPLSEHVEKMLYRSNYSINETPKYKPIIEDGEEQDDLPVEIYNTLDGQPMPNVAGTDAYLEEEDDNVDELPGAAELAPKDPVAEPTNAAGPGMEDVPPAEEPIPEPEAEADAEIDAELGVEPPAEEPVAEPEENVDEIQNEIIKHNIAAMQQIHSKLEDMEKLNMDLMSQIDQLGAKVKEVEEPTNTQKLMAQKDVSYPYYFNLNDFWKGSFFEQQRNEANEKGMKQLPDGTFIADFDDLPIPSKTDIEDSFNKLT